MNPQRALMKKLQTAINTRFDEKLLLNFNQWYNLHTEQVRDMIVLRKEVFNADKGRYIPIEVFRTPSNIQMVLFLRDYWYMLNGWELPTSGNPVWEELKEKGVTDKIRQAIEAGNGESTE